MWYFICGILALPVLVFIYEMINGQLRSRRLANRYGLHWTEVSDAYYKMARLMRETGLPPMSLKVFEATMRNTLFDKNPKVRDVRPVYCDDCDPLNPQGWWQSHK